MINKLIEQIGGRERLEALASFRPSGSNTVNSASRDEWMAMASALLAVLDAQDEPAAWIINCNSARINFAETEKPAWIKLLKSAGKTALILMSRLSTKPRQLPACRRGGRWYRLKRPQTCWMRPGSYIAFITHQLTEP